MVPLAHAARVFVARRGWTRHGFARREDFGRECFGRSGRWLGDLAALGRGLERLPPLAKALVGGDGHPPLGQVAATLIARIATRESARAWIDLARRRTVRELRVAIAEARGRGSVWPAGDGAEKAWAGEGSPAGPEAESTATPPEASAMDGSSAAMDPTPQATSASSESEPALDPAPEDRVTLRFAAPSPVCAAFDEALDPAPEDRVTLRFAAPSPVCAAFDEALDLYRAVEGTELTVTAFVEALAAEAASGGFADDGLPDRVIPRQKVADRERELAERSARWAGLGSPSGAGSAVISEVLHRLRAIEASAANAGAADLSGEIDALLALETDIDRRLGAVVLAMTEAGDWEELGFADAGHYAEERLGMSRSAATARVRLARAARRLPALRLAYDAGQLGQEAALLVVQALGRGAVEPAVERSWVNGALGHTVKRLRDEARWAGGRTGHTRAGGGSPNLMFSSGSIRTIPPLPPSDAEWHASLRRDPGRAREKVIDFAARALASPVEGALLRLTLPESVARDLLAAIEARRQALVADGAAIGRGPLPAWAGLLALLLDFVATWDDPSGLPKRASDAIYRRDGWRCMAPGCTSRRNLEDHHVVYRSRGGEDDESNRVTLCRFHHQQGEHGGAMRVRGLAPLGLVWRLGSAGSRAWYRNETRYFGAAAG